MSFFSINGLRVNVDEIVAFHEKHRTLEDNDFNQFGLIVYSKNGEKLFIPERDQTKSNKMALKMDEILNTKKIKI